MGRWSAIVGCVVAGLLAGVPPAFAGGEHRVALVIGNAAYPSAPLKNSVNDADAMARALTAQGFDVILRENTTKTQLEHAVIEFGQKLGENAIGLAYYSGHGMQVGGKNYLVPVDAEIIAEQAVPLTAVDVDSVLAQMVAARSRVNILILDACRNNPFERRFRTTTGAGLAQMAAPIGSLIAYSTAPGKVASDGDGVNGIYTGALLKAIREPGLPLEEVFKHVRTAVRAASQDAQTPWEKSSLEGEFYFLPPTPSAATAPAADVAELERLRRQAQAARLKAEIEESKAKIAKAEAERTQAEKVRADEDAAPVHALQVQTATQGPTPVQAPSVHAPPRDRIAALISATDLKSVPRLRKAAEHGDTEAQTLLGDRYHRGEGVAKDDTEAQRWYRAAASQSNALAEYKLADLLAADGDTQSESLQWIRAAADQGLPVAESKLAAMYLSGSGVPLDGDEGVRWLRAAAEQGDVAAQAQLGDLYKNGTEVLADLHEAIQWYGRAAAEGNAHAQRNLALLLATTGSTGDAEAALKWLRAAADQDDAEAADRLGDLYQSGRGVPTDRVEALRWYRKAAVAGNAEGQFNLARLLDGDGEAVEALHWVQAAADQGDLGAQRRLAEAYDTGSGVPQDFTTAATWYRAAAEQGDVAAQDRLGQMYRDGVGVPRNAQLALNWFRRAAEQGSRDAVSNLQRMSGRVHVAGTIEPRYIGQIIPAYRR